MFTNTTGKAIYVNADRTAVAEEGSAEAAFLLVGPEGQIPQEEADKYGLKADSKKAPRAETVSEATADAGTTAPASAGRADAGKAK